LHEQTEFVQAARLRSNDKQCKIGTYLIFSYKIDTQVDDSKS